jgi:hypothetical protein
MRRPGRWNEAVPVTPDESSPTFPEVSDTAADRALRRDLVLISTQRRMRHRGRRLRLV